MPDGLYTYRGWQPLGFSEPDNGMHSGIRWALLWGAICFGAAIAGMVISGLMYREKNTGGLTTQ